MFIIDFLLSLLLLTTNHIIVLASETNAQAIKAANATPIKFTPKTESKRKVEFLEFVATKIKTVEKLNANAKQPKPTPNAFHALSLKVGTWNVFEFKINGAHKENVIQTLYGVIADITAMQVEVITLQEIPNDKALIQILKLEMEKIGLPHHHHCCTRLGVCNFAFSKYFIDDSLSSVGYFNRLKLRCYFNAKVIVPVLEGVSESRSINFIGTHLTHVPKIRKHQLLLPKIKSKLIDLIKNEKEQIRELDTIEKVIMEIMEVKGNNVIVAGDFNTEAPLVEVHLHSVSNSIVKEVRENIFTNSNGLQIDHILSTLPTKGGDSYFTIKSDHLPVWCSLLLPIVKQ